ncbi:MAG TPA: hypothetical protein DCL49_13185 [Candidatus Omnitrophica bacterium]|nr:hypothetical protein [Candidatus Omnitrophota bacterium]
MADKKRVKRIAITMRVEEVAGNGELRDCLAQDWYDFMQYALPEAHWVAIPNIGSKAEVRKFMDHWNIDGVILSGGNDIGAIPKRDATERAVLSYCVSKVLPVFGVCRGLQMIQVYFGGGLQKCAREIHVRRRHMVLFHDKRYAVNSYHAFGIKKNLLSPRLIPFALTSDGWVEGIQDRSSLIAAVQWHPERGRPFRGYDRAIVRSVFGFGR